MLLDLRLDGGLRQGPYDLLDPRPILEEENGRNALDPESSRGLSVLIHIQFGDSDPSLILDRQFFKDGGNHPAGTAPLGPEIDQDQSLPFDDPLVKVLVSDVKNLIRRHTRLPIDPDAELPSPGSPARAIPC